jgi:hypothetical protein
MKLWRWTRHGKPAGPGNGGGGPAVVAARRGQSASPARFSWRQMRCPVVAPDADIVARVPAGAGAIALAVLNDRGAATVAQAFTID